jgi:hypothetical protein
MFLKVAFLSESSFVSLKAYCFTFNTASDFNQFMDEVSFDMTDLKWEALNVIQHDFGME